jgi:hypothetical protein
MKACGRARGIVTFILNVGLDEFEWYTSRSGRFIPQKEPRYQLNKRLKGVSEPVFSVWEKRKFSSLLGFEIRSIQAVI